MAIEGLIGGLVGGIAGPIESAAQNRIAKSNRRRFRRGVEQGVQQTNRAVFDVLSGPEFGAAQNFLLGTFGIGGQGGAGGPGGISFGGRTFTDRPSGFALGRGAVKQARAVGRDLARALQAQRQIETGLSGTGRPLGAKALRRAERLADPTRIQNLLTAFESGGGDFQQQALKTLGRRGFSAEALSRLQPETGGPAQLEGGGPTTAAAAGPGGFGLSSPLAQDFLSSIRQAQSSRGLFFGNAPAVNEAAGLAAFNFQQQRELLPQLLGLSTFGNQLQGQLQPGNIATAVQRRSGGTAVFGQQNPFFNTSPVAAGVQGGVAGFGAGQASGGGGLTDLIGGLI